MKPSDVQEGTLKDFLKRYVFKLFLKPSVVCGALRCSGRAFHRRGAVAQSQVKSSHLYLYSAFNKALHNTKIGKFCQCKMTGFNTQLSAECISLLNLVMALSSLVQFK